MTEIRWYEEGKPHMRIKENKGVTWLSYQAFEQFPDIVHAFSTRLGGVSQEIYSSMNLSFTRGDVMRLFMKIIAGLQRQWDFRQKIS